MTTTTKSSKKRSEKSEKSEKTAAPTHSPTPKTPSSTPKPTLPKTSGPEEIVFTFQNNSFYYHSIETTGSYLLKTLGARGGDIPVDGTIHFSGVLAL